MGWLSYSCGMQAMLSCSSVFNVKPVLLRTNQLNANDSSASLLALHFDFLSGLHGAPLMPKLSAVFHVSIQMCIEVIGQGGKVSDLNKVK
ncbi:MAG: hypothetical protein M3O09_13575 [Acidobacteriota bacterium]|nr:hypothetical protein [Acidobacteriota bacterium]